VPYEAKPAIIVAPYASPTVRRSIFPAFLPISAIAGATIPRIISGTRKLRSWLKISLKVTKILIPQLGNIPPSKMPNTIATSTCGKSPILKIFFILFNITFKEASFKYYAAAISSSLNS
jgi:hypothetical protein